MTDRKASTVIQNWPEESRLAQAEEEGKQEV